jgi:enoyl-CoA hydratase/carnithine racemase
MSDPVRLEVSGGIAMITLARPEKLNALDDVMVELLGRHADAIDADRSVPAVILTGEGKAFCASGDIAAWGGLSPLDMGLSMRAKALAVRLAPEAIPVFEVRPGVIRTDMTAKVAAKYDARIADGLIPAGRWGEGEDVAACVAALTSGQFAYATGTVINADGGLLIPRL